MNNRSVGSKISMEHSATIVPAKNRDEMDSPFPFANSRFFEPDQKLKTQSQGGNRIEDHHYPNKKDTHWAKKVKEDHNSNFQKTQMLSCHSSNMFYSSPKFYQEFNEEPMKMSVNSEFFERPHKIESEELLLDNQNGERQKQQQVEENPSENSDSDVSNEKEHILRDVKMVKSVIQLNQCSPHSTRKLIHTHPNPNQSHLKIEQIGNKKYGEPQSQQQGGCSKEILETRNDFSLKNPSEEEIFQANSPLVTGFECDVPSSDSIKENFRSISKPQSQGICLIPNKFEEKLSDQTYRIQNKKESKKHQFDTNEVKVDRQKSKIKMKMQMSFSRTKQEPLKQSSRGKENNQNQINRKQQITPRKRSVQQVSTNQKRPSEVEENFLSLRKLHQVSPNKVRTDNILKQRLTKKLTKQFNKFQDLSEEILVQKMMSTEKACQNTASMLQAFINQKEDQSIKQRVAQTINIIEELQNSMKISRKERNIMKKDLRNAKQQIYLLQKQIQNQSNTINSFIGSAQKWKQSFINCYSNGLDAIQNTLNLDDLELESENSRSLIQERQKGNNLQEELYGDEVKRRIQSIETKVRKLKRNEMVLIKKLELYEQELLKISLQAQQNRKKRHHGKDQNIQKVCQAILQMVPKKDALIELFVSLSQNQKQYQLRLTEYRTELIFSYLGVCLKSNPNKIEQRVKKLKDVDIKMIREVSKLKKKNVDACVNIMEDFYSSLIQLAKAN